MQPDSISHGAVKTEAQHRSDICMVGRWIHDRGFVASTDGNVSVRLGADRILMSPTCMSKGMMTPDDLVIIDNEGRRVDGTRKPSSELGMHLLIYRLRPDVNAICHAHPPTATGFARPRPTRPSALAAVTSSSIEAHSARWGCRGRA